MTYEESNSLFIKVQPRENSPSDIEEDVWN